MDRRKAIAVVGIVASACGVIALLWIQPWKDTPVKTVDAACTIAKAAWAEHAHISLSDIEWCEGVVPEAQPQDYYIIELHGHCAEDVCGSTLIGWFAVQKSNSRFFEMDVGDWEVGKPI